MPLKHIKGVASVISWHFHENMQQLEDYTSKAANCGSQTWPIHPIPNAWRSWQPRQTNGVFWYFALKLQVQVSPSWLYLTWSNAKQFILFGHLGSWLRTVGVMRCVDIWSNSPRAALQALGRLHALNAPSNPKRKMEKRPFALTSK